MYGQIAAAVFGTISIVAKMFSKVPSQTQILTWAINAQTRQIEAKIEQQTEILKAYFEAVMLQNSKLAEHTVKEIQRTDFYQIIDDMYGVAASLNVKQKHLERFQSACIRSGHLINFFCFLFVKTH